MVQSAADIGTKVILYDATLAPFLLGATPDPLGNTTGTGAGIVSVPGLAAGAVNGNTITLDLGTTTINSSFIGGGYAVGAAHNHDATGNAIIMNSGTVGGSGTGSLVGGVSASGAGSGNVTRNAVVMYNGTVGYQVIGGGTTHGTATYNMVTIHDGTVGGTVYGGLVKIATGGVANFNLVEIYGGTLGGSVVSGNSEGNDARNNMAYIFGGTIASDVIGGRTYAAAGNASNNLVVISGGTIGLNIIGGQLMNTGATGVANDNMIILSGNPVLTAANVYGGIALGGTSNVLAGNFLVFDNYRGTGTTAASPIQLIQNFQYFAFRVDRPLVNNDVVIYANNVIFGTVAEPSQVTEFVMAGGASPSLKVGDTINLIRATSMTGTFTTTDNRISGLQGRMLRYDLLITVVGNDLKATVQGLELDEATKALSEAFFGSMGLLVNSFDFVASQGMDSAQEAVRGSTIYGDDSRVAVFGTAYGGKVRYDTGSHVDVSSFSGMIGVSAYVHWDALDMTIGVFGEAGNGKYDTYNSFTDFTVEGKGDINYGGAGILVRLDFQRGMRGNFHLEFSGRVGGVKNKFNSVNGNETIFHYETKSNYYGLHLGAGYTFNFDEKYLLDVYAKYFWTFQEGDTVRLATGDLITFDDVNSHRLRGGVRLTLNGPEKFKPYFGVAYEHEMAGKVKATAYGLELPKPDASGGSFVGELGLLVLPSEKVAINIGVQGYGGARRGITGSIGLKFTF
ncbi:MAG: autotransporter outer membrane beta-barrel domain-containing protein [Deltaproteobacteria bacterium]|nr:autotransporter outer membrane beta-barrel domain-containing protein [Deltaproteobacteria bacterium]